jgi:hypothetical protein
MGIHHIGGQGTAINRSVKSRVALVEVEIRDLV